MKNIIIIAVLIFSAIACKETSVKNNLLPGVSGKAGELVLVIDKKYYEDESGSLLRQVFHQDCPGLPQAEPLFNLVQIPHKAFGDIFKIHRNIIFVYVGNGHKEAKITIQNDVNARPQTIVNVVAPNKESLLNLLIENEQKLLSIFVKAEQKRLANNYGRYADLTIMDKLEKRKGIKLTVPKGYTYDLDTNNFIWLAHETPQISQGVFIYSYPYNDTSDFTKQALLDKRNEMLKKYVSGPADGSYMTTETQVPPLFSSYNHNNEYTAELRGLWKLEGDYMGGPFVSISKLDPNTGNIITVEGFVYAPKFNKRNYVRQLEAILFSLEFVKE